MNDPVLVNVLDSCEDLLHELDGLCFVKALPFHNVIEKLTTLCVLHDEMNVSFGFNDFVELDDVGVTEDFKDADLSSDSFDVGLFYDFLFLKGFDGDFLLSENVCTKLDLTERTFSNGGTDAIVAENDFALSISTHLSLNFVIS